MKIKTCSYQRLNINLLLFKSAEVLGQAEGLQNRRQVSSLLLINFLSWSWAEGLNDLGDRRTYLWHITMHSGGAGKQQNIAPINTDNLYLMQFFNFKLTRTDAWTEVLDVTFVLFVQQIW